MWRFCTQILLVLLALEECSGQSLEESSCYGAGSITAAVIVTFIVTILLIYVCYECWRRYWVKRKKKHLVSDTDLERGKDEYAYDNDGFAVGTGGGGDVTSTLADKTFDKNGKLEFTKSKWTQWSPLGALITKHDKSKTLDDSTLATDEIRIVSLKSHDFTGLGFNIYGNMRDGIFIKDILHRGPAFESGKLNPGDRIKSVIINFEHVVYEDALTILSYASPYEVTLKVQNGKSPQPNPTSPGKAMNLGHPLFRSSSMTDLIQIQKRSKRRLFSPEEEPSNVITNLQKTLSNMTTLERKHSGSPKSESLKTQSTSPEQLKTQLEQKIIHNYKQQLMSKDNKPVLEPEIEPPKTENKYQKFGIKVLPMGPLTTSESQPKEQISPKSAENSQNDNNINLERHFDRIKSVDEVDVSPAEQNTEENYVSVANVTSEETQPFTRESGSGIRRDKDGIPQEIPSHMLNAAVAARRNRKGSFENLTEDIKSPKRPKGRAPAPPNDKPSPSPTNEASKIDNDEDDKKDYISDSDTETDNKSSVNTIELNASDITIHQTEDSEDMQNRRTASTGDLTKIQKTHKTNVGTLERAQSLDITDSGVPTLCKKRKGGSIEENLESKSGSDDSLYGKALVHKEPRLSLDLDGLNTFQRNRLKKSTEWGNLEDAIINLDMSESQNDNTLSYEEDNEKQNHSITLSLGSPEISPASYKFNNQSTMVVFDDKTNPDQTVRILLDDQGKTSLIECNSDQDSQKCPNSLIQDIVLVQENIITEPIQLFENSIHATVSFLDSEKQHCSSIDPFYNVPHKLYDTNVSDDMKVSRHSLHTGPEPLEDSRTISTYNGNVSNITISDKSIDNEYFLEKPLSEKTIEDDDLYVTALDTSQENNLQITSIFDKSNSCEKTSLTLKMDPNETVNLEGPTSLTLDISGDDTDNSIKSSEVTSKPNYSLTYITEIQVTPTNNNNNNTKTDSIVLNVNKDEISEPPSINMNSTESHVQLNNNNTKDILNDKIDLQKELHKIQEIAEEQLKKLPEMRFSTSSYESTKQTESAQVDQLRLNFERSPSKATGKSETASKSRIPVATAKTPPTSPERRDSRNFDLEVDKDIVAIMSSPVHSTPLKYQPKVTTRNVSVTSIRSNSKIPSGFPSRPPVPPRKYDNLEYETNTGRLSTNGNIDSSFKQWVFSPSDTSVNVTVTGNKSDYK